MENQELDFNAIIGGEDNAAKTQQAAKLTTTDTRARQQSCMINDINKDLLPSNINNKPQQNFRMSLSNMLNMDKTDESLEAYKKSLLGDVKQQALKQDEAAEVQLIKVEIVSQDRPNNNIVLDFSNFNTAKDTHKFTIKQGAIYCLRVHFKVKYDIVFMLKFVNNVYKAVIRVDKSEDMMGSYPPQEQAHTFDLPWTEAPSGFLARGDYKGKGLFLDNDGIVHCQFNYVMKIDKQW